MLYSILRLPCSEKTAKCTIPDDTDNKRIEYFITSSLVRFGYSPLPLLEILFLYVNAKTAPNTTMAEIIPPNTAKLKILPKFCETETLNTALSQPQIRLLLRIVLGESTPYRLTLLLSVPSAMLSTIS